MISFILSIFLILLVLVVVFLNKKSNYFEKKVDAEEQKQCNIDKKNYEHIEKENIMEKDSFENEKKIEKNNVVEKNKDVPIKMHINSRKDGKDGKINSKKKEQVMATMKEEEKNKGKKQYRHGEPTRLFYSFSGRTMQMFDSGSFDEDGEMKICNDTTAAHALILYIVMKKIFKENGFWDEEKKNALTSPFISGHKLIKASGNLDYLEYEEGGEGKILDLINSTDYKHFELKKTDFDECKKEVLLSIKENIKKTNSNIKKIENAFNRKDEKDLVQSKIDELDERINLTIASCEYYKKKGDVESLKYHEKFCERLSKLKEKYIASGELTDEDRNGYRETLSFEKNKYLNRLNEHQKEVECLKFEDVLILQKDLFLCKDVVYY